MAILINQKPSVKGLVYNDNTWIIGSTIGTLTSFRYHIRVFLAPLSATPTIHWEGYIYPRQETQGLTYFDPKRILESLTSYDIAIPSDGHNGFFPNDDSHTEYTLRIAEQTKNASNQWVEQAFILSDERSVWNGGLTKRGWLSFDYTDFDVVVSDTDARFLTEGPTTRYQNSNDSSWLYFTTSEDEAPTHLTVKSYDANDTLLSTETIENPHDAAIAVNAFTHRKYQYMRVVTGRADLNAVDASYKSATNIVDPDAVYYTVQLRGVSSVQSELVTYYIDQHCSKYSPIRLHWLNELGGFDSFNFILKSVEGTEIDRKDFVKQHHVWDNGTWSYTQASRGRTDYSVEYEDNLILNADYMTEAEAVWMKSLFTSPVVYMESGTDLIAVNVRKRNYTKMTTINDKLKQYDIELGYSLTEHRQRG